MENKISIFKKILNKNATVFSEYLKYKEEKNYTFDEDDANSILLDFLLRSYYPKIKLIKTPYKSEDNKVIEDIEIKLTLFGYGMNFKPNEENKKTKTEEDSILLIITYLNQSKTLIKLKEKIGKTIIKSSELKLTEEDLEIMFKEQLYSKELIEDLLGFLGFPFELDYELEYVKSDGEIIRI